MSTANLAKLRRSHCGNAVCDGVDGPASLLPRVPRQQTDRPFCACECAACVEARQGEDLVEARIAREALRAASVKRVLLEVVGAEPGAWNLHSIRELADVADDFTRAEINEALLELLHKGRLVFTAIGMLDVSTWAEQHLAQLVEVVPNHCGVPAKPGEVTARTWVCTVCHAFFRMVEPSRLRPEQPQQPPAGRTPDRGLEGSTGDEHCGGRFCSHDDDPHAPEGCGCSCDACGEAESDERS